MNQKILNFHVSLLFGQGAFSSKNKIYFLYSTKERRGKFIKSFFNGDAWLPSNVFSFFILQHSHKKDSKRPN